MAKRRPSRHPAPTRRSKDRGLSIRSGTQPRPRIGLHESDTHPSSSAPASCTPTGSGAISSGEEGAGVGGCLAAAGRDHKRVTGAPTHLDRDPGRTRARLLQRSPRRPRRPGRVEQEHRTGGTLHQRRCGDAVAVPVAHGDEVVGPTEGIVAAAHLEAARDCPPGLGAAIAIDVRGGARSDLGARGGGGRDEFALADRICRRHRTRLAPRKGGRGGGGRIGDSRGLGPPGRQRPASGPPPPQHRPPGRQRHRPPGRQRHGWRCGAAAGRRPLLSRGRRLLRHTRRGRRLAGLDGGSDDEARGVLRWAAGFGRRLAASHLTQPPTNSAALSMGPSGSAAASATRPS